MTEIFETNRSLTEKPHPGEVAAFLNTKRQALGAAAAELSDIQSPEREDSDAIALPRSGGELITGSGEVRFFVPALKYVYDPSTGRDAPRPYTLRDYFSHTATDGKNGPGWDMRTGLYELSQRQMLERYGHVFTREEILSPGGVRDPETGKLTGGMPDDVLYYDLVDREEYEYLKSTGAI